MKRPPNSVLLWEPDPLQAHYLDFVFKEAGFNVAGFERWQEFEKALAQTAAYPVLVVLALGHDLAKSIRHCQRLRQQYPLMNLMVLSHHQGQFDSEQSIEAAVFQAGADDYLQKPLDSQLLLIRSQARLLRSQQIIDQIARPKATSSLQYGPFTLNAEHQQVQIGQTQFSPGALEYKLLHCLCQHAGHYVSRQTLSLWLWQHAQPPHSRKLDNLVLNLRKHLPLQVELKSKYGQGYGLFWEPN